MQQKGRVQKTASRSRFGQDVVLVCELRFSVLLSRFEILSDQARTSALKLKLRAEKLVHGTREVGRLMIIHSVRDVDREACPWRPRC